MVFLETGRLTVSGGQFDWGGHLNYGAHRQQCLWKHLAVCWDLRSLHLKYRLPFQIEGMKYPRLPIHEMMDACNNILVRTISREVVF